MALNEFELHPERLGTTDGFGRRVFPQPADVRGKYRTRRNWTEAILILIFLILPWIRISGRQALLLDIAHRKFEIFGLSLRAHDAPLLFFVFAAVFLSLFFATAIWGRVWCGWACPQTVFIDGVFRRIERWIEGSALERRKLDHAPMSLSKFAKRAAKWTGFLAVTLVISHSFLAYFVGTEELEVMVTSSPYENWTSFLVMAITTGILLFNFGWFREQFCIIACPYGRFQSVLMDSHSMIVTYDPERGEPRSTPQAKAHSRTHGAKLGDCVNCYRCVQVCPVGIDIRRGVQMECIACTGCIDACDDVMTKLKKPTGLIRYDSLRGLQKRKTTVFRPRVMIYAAALTAAVLTLTLLLKFMKPVSITLFRAKETPYQVINTDAETIVINHYKVEVSNQSESLHNLDFSTDDPTLELVSAQRPLPVDKGQIGRPSLFIRFPKSTLLNGQRTALIRIIDTDMSTQKKIIQDKEVSLVGPFN